MLNFSCKLIPNGYAYEDDEVKFFKDNGGSGKKKQKVLDRMECALRERLKELKEFTSVIVEQLRGITAAPSTQTTKDVDLLLSLLERVSHLTKS